MSETLMVLPGRRPEGVRVIEVPADFEEHEAYRHVIGIIAAVQEANPECTWNDVAEALEDQGFRPRTFILGPELACRS